MFRLSFEDTEEGRARYEICYQAIVLTGRQIAVSEWDDCVGLLSKFKAAGEDKGTKIGTTVLLDLKSGGAEINLERGEKALLVSFIEQPMWRPPAIPAAQKTRMWLNTLVDEPNGKP